LSNGNYLVLSTFWNGNQGAVTWGNGSTGTTGTISAANSLVGVTNNGFLKVIPLINGNYVVVNPSWNGQRGAVTWGNGTTGISGTVSEANSLVGNPGDQVGGGRNANNSQIGAVIALSNGNYVVASGAWNGSRGAVTWGNGTTGISGTVTEANSLVGSNSGDEVGGYFGTALTPLSNGNYVVDSPNWNGRRGAVTWENGSTAVTGIVSEANSLVGSSTGDQVGSSLFGIGVVPLSNGNYLVESPSWNDGRGAVTWGNGSTGISGTVSAANSLVGSSPGDRVPFSESDADNIKILSNGNYLVYSADWKAHTGAVTWGNGDTGVSGVISEANSLVGSSPNDSVGLGGFTILSNGNYLVGSLDWNGMRGAVTWGNGSTGVSGTISAANSLVGSKPLDEVGYYGVTPLSNGNYVASNPAWNGSRGAATWGNGSTGVSGIISDANSLVGSSLGDRVGDGGVVPLSNGNYVVASPGWNGNRGAATWGNGSTGITGTISAANSLVGSNPFDTVGRVTALSNGTYVVGSSWNDNRGALTWGNGNTGISGTISLANSLVGSNPGDMLGVTGTGQSLIIPLSSGNYIVPSHFWNNSRGAVTFVNGTTGQTLDGMNVIRAQNSLLGQVPNAGLRDVVLDPSAQSFLAPFGSGGSGRITVGLTDPNELSYARAQAQTMSVTPDFLTGTLNTGTAVVLQASNDITINSPIIVSAGGQGGALTLQAGRSIILKASITTDSGDLTLIANDQLANGVIDAQRDPGNAAITMAPGTSLNTGSGALTVALRDGAGLTHPDSGAITLQSVLAGSVSVVNNGPSAGSDVDLRSVTTSGVQNYADPNGITRVSGNLTAANPITFNDSVVLSDGVSVDAGFGSVNFAGNGVQRLQSGVGASLGYVLHNGTGTLQLSSGLTVRGRFTNESGIFDANNQPVTVAGLTTVAGGTYLTGTAPESLDGGLVILAGVFTSSTGPMSVSGGIILTGGHTSFGVLSGVGAVDTLTTLGGTLAPGGASPGVLSVTSALVLHPETTVSILLDGTAPGTGYAQLQAGGLIALGGSTLSLGFGFVPPLQSTFEIVTNNGSTPISGTFNGLTEGAVFTQGGYQFQITYQGGTGGDSVVLTRLA
jgi:hypothetical protein